jgi:hypothetical protein
VASELGLTETQVSLRRLRTAIQNNEVSFPSQVPRFQCQSRADIQWRLAELYFIHNWTCPDLGRRYGVTMERARQLVFNWVQRAIVLGYLQEIPASPPYFADAVMGQVTDAAAIDSGSCQTAWTRAARISRHLSSPEGWTRPATL